MNRVILTYLVVFVMISLSCKSTAQEKTIDSINNIKTVDDKPKFSEKDIYERNSPNTIKLIGEIINFEHHITLCNKVYEDIIIFKVIKIISSGSSIVNPLVTNKNFKGIFFKRLLNKKSPNLELRKGDLYEIIVSEQLCHKDAGKTNYMVTSLNHRSLN